MAHEPSSYDERKRSLAIAIALHSFFLKAPVFAYLNSEIKKNFLVKKGLQCTTRLSPKSLDVSALLSNDNAFLRIASDVYNRTDTQELRLVLEALDFNLATIWYLCSIQQQDFFSYDFRREELFRFIRQRVCWI